MQASPLQARVLTACGEVAPVQVAVAVGVEERPPLTLHDRVDFLVIAHTAGAAKLIGEPARAQMLIALLAGRAMTATELVHGANVSPQTASSHLSQMLDGELLALEKQGRHHY